MTDAIRLFIVTNEPWTACQSVLARRPTNLPSWALCLSTPTEIAALPEGATAVSYWENAGSNRSAQEWAWIARRERGGFQAGLTAPEIDKLTAWANGEKPSLPAPGETPPAPTTTERVLAENWT